MVEEVYHDVTVLGAGWSGVLATKYMLEEGLSVIALEKRESYGGTWRFSKDPTICTVMKSTVSTSSSAVTEMSDFPMPEDLGQFPHHSSILGYLGAYIEKFNLSPHIRYNENVVKTEKKTNYWYVHSDTSTLFKSRYLLVCTGPNQQPNLEILDQQLKGFTGAMYHSIMIKEFLTKYKDQRLLLIGGGETASDIVQEWLDQVKFIYWSIPNGQHFFRKFAKILPWKDPQALDKASSRLLTAAAPYHLSKPGLKWICKWTSNGSLLAYQGHGIPEWKNETPFFCQVINKNGKVLDSVDYKKLVPKGGIASCQGKKVAFLDGTAEEFDIIILCTGYTNVSSSILPQVYSQVHPRRRYKYVFDPADPSLAFIGYVRPIVGSIPVISELQSRWVAKVFRGKISLATEAEMQAAIEQDEQFWQKYFQFSTERYKGQPIVEGFLYVDQVAKLAGVYPNYWSLLRHDPQAWFTAVSAPFSSSTYRLNESQHKRKAIAIMKKHQKGTTNPLHIILILFLRFTFIDWALEKLGNLKFMIQMSAWWRSIRSYRVIRAADYVWCTPKRLLFDNNSYI